MTKTVVLTPAEASKELKRIMDVITAKPETKRRILIRGVLEVADRMRAYPAAGPWNSPPGSRGDNRWYSRGFGPRWYNEDGSLGGENTSQRLQKSWQTEVSEAGKEFTGHVFTRVTYAPRLHTPGRRAPWAASHGWQTTKQVADGYVERFKKVVLIELDNDVKKL